MKQVSLILAQSERLQYTLHMLVKCKKHGARVSKTYESTLRNGIIVFREERVFFSDNSMRNQSLVL